MPGGLVVNTYHLHSNKTLNRGVETRWCLKLKELGILQFGEERHSGRKGRWESFAASKEGSDKLAKNRNHQKLVPTGFEPVTKKSCSINLRPNHSARKPVGEWDRQFEPHTSRLR